MWFGCRDLGVSWLSGISFGIKPWISVLGVYLVRNGIWDRNLNLVRCLNWALERKEGF